MKAPAFWEARDSVLATALSPLGRVWNGLEVLHRVTARATKVGVPVLCVGNLVAGGAGKTPVALDLGRRLVARSVKAMYLSRGYGGREIGPMRVDPASHDARRMGDEPMLLSRVAPCWVSRKRVFGAQAAQADGAEFIIMDDGFQNPWLHKDLSLLVVDGPAGFGNGRIMPAGPLRESVRAGFARAHGVVIIGEDRHDLGERARLAGLPVLMAEPEPGPEIEFLRGQPLLAFAGIGRPGKFFDALERWGCDVVASRGFADHHFYRADQMEALLAEADHLGALPVTTEKDWVRIPDGSRDHVETLGLRLRWLDDAQPEALLDRLLNEDHGRI